MPVFVATIFSLKAFSMSPPISPRSPNIASTSHQMNVFEPHGLLTLPSKLWNALRNIVVPPNKQEFNREIPTTVTGVGCPAHTAVNVLIGHPSQINASIHANVINLDSQRFKRSASAAIGTARIAMAGQSPQDFNLCERFLAQSLISGKGLFQFVSPRANKTTLGISSKRSKESKAIPIIDQLKYQWERSLLMNETIYLAGQRFEVTGLEPKILQENSPSEDHCSYELTAIDRSDGSTKKILLTQAGFSFSDRVLSMGDIERANDLMNLQVEKELNFPTCSKATQQSIQADPLVVSYAGIGRNATLITYRETLSRMKAEPDEKILDEKWLDDTLFDIVRAGREDRGLNFIHSDAQLQALRSALMHKIESRTVHTIPGPSKRDEAMRSSVSLAMLPIQLPLSPQSILPASAIIDTNHDIPFTSLTIQEKTLNDLYNEWHIWERQIPGGSQEDRKTAVENMKLWIDKNDTNAKLKLNDLRLTSLPDNLPPGVRHLEIFLNRLTCLPENLPDSLAYMDAGDNCLTKLPAKLPLNLKSLIISNNELTQLTGSLPAELEIINASFNSISKLPDYLPTSLKSLQLTRNRITTLPETLPDSIENLMLNCNELVGFPDKLPDALKELSVGSNYLTVLPENFPQYLEKLDLSSNSIEILPYNLPATITTLTVVQNNLTGLPETLPESLEKLSAFNNHITKVPDTLPSGLKKLLLSDNELTDISNSLPTRLEEIDVSNNRLTGLVSLARFQELKRLNLLNNSLTNLPDDIFHLNRNCEIQLETSGFSDGVFNRLAFIAQDVNYAGPRIIFQTRAARDPLLTRPLNEEVCSWREELTGTQFNQWNSVWNDDLTRETTIAFSTFLSRARQISDYTNGESRPATVQRINLLLDQLQSNSNSRVDCYNIAVEAIGSCNDRIALRLIDMEIQCRIDITGKEIDEGGFDSAPQALITLCKGIYRLKILARAAERKANSLNLVDPIEVHLGYILRFAEEFSLPVQIKSMQFPRLADLTQEDLLSARRELSSSDLPDEEKITSNAEYLLFLSTYPLMVKMLRRIVPDRMETAMREVEPSIEARKAEIYKKLEQLDDNADDYQLRAVELNEDFRRVDIEAPGQAIRPVLLDFLAQNKISATF
ncbi:NEL-type E3 ubiquitin ligase domain-containing protein [Actimicrobium sp. CCC2.4]|uniref:NEL-type E3 ubiquitin ligase domain-containing protein n=1 Tax=Actimicrobium sp. CCC2.4 TaxID=3048606 RepID=UPI002AC89EA7|nr:NEL-type E3 ubiquitin ligase domain-containing protein [Actimicrobium sp. CCC2.4]MEB0133851.1 NEL-type E3 ubiquitin ligase domain-containing protein [Actimicrobium sp. CCC2.4]WPX31393.1 NEL-type E3 ubiquitin ligase domain-containing protein [Actimicrobium sp. CCC2.4]